uniref:Uncharacterized protein n=1 Tax=Oryza glumipatula TaxID=40148 RepID=A0A0E0BN21_9ORYZ
MDGDLNTDGLTVATTAAEPTTRAVSEAEMELTAAQEVPGLTARQRERTGPMSSQVSRSSSLKAWKAMLPAKPPMLPACRRLLSSPANC